MTWICLISLILFFSLSAQYSFDEFEEDEESDSMIVHPDIEERIEPDSDDENCNEIVEIIIIEED